MASIYKMWQFTVSLIIFLLVNLAYAKSNQPLVILNEDTWTDMLQGEWLVKFYAPWCPACRALGPIWDGVASWSEDLEIKVAKIDVTDNPALSGRFLVTSLPTVYHVKDGEFRVYRGKRDENELVSFVDDGKWKEVEPVSWYTAPDSIHMGALGMFFKVSMAIRDLHDKMTTDYGIPVWGSYAIFAVATIIVGLLIGLLIVFLCDALLPNHPPEHSSYLSTRSHGGPMGARYLAADDDDKSDIVDDLPPKASEEPSLATGDVLPEAGRTAEDEEELSQGEEEGSQAGEDSQEGSQVGEGSQAGEDSQDEEGSQGEDASGDQATGGDLRPERPKTARRRKPQTAED